MGQIEERVKRDRRERGRECFYLLDIRNGIKGDVLRFEKFEIIEERRRQGDERGKRQKSGES